MAAPTKKPRPGATDTLGMCRLVRLGGGHRSVRLSRALELKTVHGPFGGAANARLSGLSRGLSSVDAEQGPVHRSAHSSYPYRAMISSINSVSVSAFATAGARSSWPWPRSPRSGPRIRRRRTAGRTFQVNLVPCWSVRDAGPGRKDDVGGPALDVRRRRHRPSKSTMQHLPRDVTTQRRLGPGRDPRLVAVALVALGRHRPRRSRGLPDAARDLYVPPGDISFWQGAIRDRPMTGLRGPSRRHHRPRALHHRAAVRGPRRRPASHQPLHPRPPAGRWGWHGVVVHGQPALEPRPARPPMSTPAGAAVATLASKRASRRADCDVLGPPMRCRWPWPSGSSVGASALRLPYPRRRGASPNACVLGVHVDHQEERRPPGRARTQLLQQEQRLRGQLRSTPPRHHEGRSPLDRRRSREHPSLGIRHLHLGARVPGRQPRPQHGAGLFTYDSDPSFNNREIDIEASRWGNG